VTTEGLGTGTRRGAGIETEKGTGRETETEIMAEMSNMINLEGTGTEVGREIEMPSVDEAAHSTMIIDGHLLPKSQNPGNNRKTCIQTDEESLAGTDPFMLVALMAVAGLVERGLTLWRGTWRIFCPYISC
jgi:hypothetical protein